MKRLLLICLSLLFVLSACQAAPPAETITGSAVKVDGGSYLNVTPAELNSMLANKDFVFVNVHIPFAGNIANTDLSIAYDQIEQNLTQLPADKNAKIVLYCRSGRMSAIAAEALVKLGYTNLWNLDGGMVAWEQAGYEIQK
ncbi:MAG: rhodanese-like domain-containing protein [Chloroflexi bacterium]|nr:rhodanese-like domain-containing protein [Chloroflexota bacterium]